ncbi:TBC1 domain family member 12 [Dissostichus eleginoides]|uniref:TBC1 domain family member 12 n=1 Tax=Dissostichus eleginoides TaxID=100907 RepID=A0AAD9EU16_DISEL|nr:TBC1 domain family member 12 [Dissostichus eleginoides]
MAAVLLLNMEELQVFISLSNLSNRPCRRAFSRGDHPTVHPSLQMLRYFGAFQPLPLEVSCRVWDVYLRDGEDFLFRTALGILSLHQNILLELELVSIAQFLSRLPEEELLSDRLFSCIAATPPLSGNRKWTQPRSKKRRPSFRRLLKTSA